MRSFGLKSLIDIPTRVSRTSSTLIDHMFSNVADGCCSISVLNTAISDHDAQLCQFHELSGSGPLNLDPTFAFRRSFSPAKMEDFRLVLEVMDWGPVYRAGSTEEKMKLFMNLLMKEFNIYFPARYVKIGESRKIKWIT